MAAKDYIGFTMDLRKLVSVLAQDPTCRADIMAGLQGAPEPLTSQLGAANMAEKGQEHDWCSLFPATVQGKLPGQEGLFYRNNSNGGAGDRIQMRLKRQTQQYSQPAQSQYPAPAVTWMAVPAAEQEAAIAQLKGNTLFAQLLEAIAKEQGGAQLNAAQEVQAVQQPPQQAAPGPQIPSDIQEILNKAG